MCKYFNNTDCFMYCCCFSIYYYAYFERFGFHIDNYVLHTYKLHWGCYYSYSYLVVMNMSYRRTRRMGLVKIVIFVLTMK